MTKGFYTIGKQVSCLYFKKISLSWGNVIIGISDDAKVKGIWFEGQKYFPIIEEDSKWNGKGISDEINVVMKEAVKQLIAYDKGELETFELPIEPDGTSFRQEVWQRLMKIPYGETTTYGAIAKQLAMAMGKETMSAQAVGGAVGHNPISIVIPCHRVLGGRGELTGYAGGLEKKEGLLKHESNLKIGTLEKEMLKH